MDDSLDTVYLLFDWIRVCECIVYFSNGSPSIVE